MLTFDQDREIAVSQAAQMIAELPPAERGPVLKQGLIIYWQMGLHEGIKFGGSVGIVIGAVIGVLLK